MIYSKSLAKHIYLYIYIYIYIYKETKPLINIPYLHEKSIINIQLVVKKEYLL